MAFKVVRGIPRRVAAVLTTPADSRKTRRMWSRSTSSSVEPLVVSPSARNSDKGARRFGPRERITDRSMKFSSSRTFPGQDQLSKRFHGFRGDLVNGPIHFGRVLFGEVAGQAGDVLGVIAQRGSNDGENLQPIVQIAAE